MQAKVYQDMGYQNPLDQQKDNVVLKNEKARRIVENGATTAFDVWYEWDKPIYNEDEIFLKMLDFVKEHDTQSLLNNN